MKYYLWRVCLGRAAASGANVGGHPAGDRGTVGEVLLLTLLNRQILGQEVIVCRGHSQMMSLVRGRGIGKFLQKDWRYSSFHCLHILIVKPRVPYPRAATPH